MAMFKTLSDLKKAISVPSGNSVAKDRFLIVRDGESYRIRFLQDLTESSSGYDEEAGLARLVNVHSNPDDFRKDALCTKDMEQWNHSCWACEQITKNKMWKPKQHLFVNVAVFDPDEKTWSVKILDQKFTAAHIGNTVVEYAEEYNTIVDRDYKISRTGEKQNTKYSLIPLAEKPRAEEIDSLTLFDLDKVKRLKSPAEQPAFYLESEDKEDKGQTNEWE